MFTRIVLSGMLLALVSTAAQAQATRTWVSGVGDDVNPCSRTAPCKTFPGAISKTAAGGEINCLDPGGFGVVTITKSIIIDCGGTFGSILASGTTGVIVNAAGINVVLRNLSINGAGTGIIGVRFLQGASLQMENVVIRNFNTTTGIGVQFTPSSGAELNMVDVVVANNGTAAAGAGINIKPTGASLVRVVLNRVDISNNFSGLVADGIGSSSGLNVTVRDSVSSNNTTNGFTALTQAGQAASVIMLDNVNASNNLVAGVRADGSGAVIRIGGSTITGNGTGASIANSGVLGSYKNNLINGNTNDGTPIGQVNLN